MKYISGSRSIIFNPLRKIVAVAASVILIGLVIMFSAVFFTIILIAAAIAWTFLWWKTRELRKQMNNISHGSIVMEGRSASGGVGRGEVIEGEAIRVVDSGFEK